MFEELRKKTFKTSLIWSVILLIAGGLLTFLFADEVIDAVTGYENFEQLTPEEIKDQNVDFAMTTNFGCCMEEYEYNEDTKETKTTHLYYVVWTGDEYVTAFRYMAVKVPADMADAMEEMANNTYQDMYSDPIHVSGKIKEFDDEEYEYFKEYFKDAGWTDEDIEGGTLPYYIDCYKSKAGTIVLNVFLFLLGVLLIVWAVYRVIKGAKGGYLKKFEQDYTAAGYTEGTIRSDYNHSIPINKKANFKIGRLMIYYQLISEVRAIPVKKLMWAYMNRVTHRTNGIKTGTSYNLMLLAEGEKNPSSFSMDNEQTALDALEKIEKMFPWVVVGYSDQLKNLHAKDPAAFADLRYNTCEHTAVEPGFEAFYDQTVNGTTGTEA